MANVLPQVKGLKGAALDFFFPRFCVGCGKEGAFICTSCLASLPRIDTSVCVKCGKPLIASSLMESNLLLCSNCTGWETDIDGIRSPYRFEGVIRKAVHEFKYRNLRAISVQLAELLADYLAENPIPYEVILPIPLHTKRIRERGYNQAGLLCRELSRLTGVPVNDTTLIRGVYNMQQAKTVSVEERHKNVIGIFQVVDVDLHQKRVLLIDDVTTSGATLNACAGVLKKSGIKSVWGLTLAREI
jgi:ComF family protein